VEPVFAYFALSSLSIHLHGGTTYPTAFAFIIIIIVIIYLLKSTEQEDAHMINTRTRAGHEMHRKLALTFCPLKKQKKTNTHDIKITTTFIRTFFRLLLWRGRDGKGRKGRGGEGTPP